MYRVILCAAVVVLVAAAVQPATADDRSVCISAIGDEAIAACTRILAVNPKDAVAYDGRGEVYIGKGDYNRAISDLDHAIRLSPKLAVAYNDRGYAYHLKGDYDRAIPDLDHAIWLNPKFAMAYNNRGNVYVDKGDYDRAASDYDQAIRLNPKFVFAYAGRGKAYYHKGDYDHATSDLDEAIRLDPKYAVAYSSRGVVYESKGDYDRAISDYNEAIRLEPKLAVAWTGRGGAYSKKGNFERAITDLSEAILLNPKNAVAYNNRGDAYNGTHDYERAISDLNEAIRLDPKNAVAYSNRGDSYRGKGDYDRAIADYDEAIRHDPYAFSAYAGRGEAYEAKNDLGHAIADFDQALAVLPSHADVPPWRERLQVLLAHVSAKRSNPGPQTASTALMPPAKRALVIGINAYPNLGGAAQLERAVADAEAVGDKLVSLGFQVTRLTKASQTTLDGIIHGFDEFRKTVVLNDMVVLFYAGHGMGLSDGTYLVPGDVREASLQVEATAKRAAISENELTDPLRRARAGIVVAVIDACRNDLFTKATQRAIGNERGLRPVETAGIFKLYSASEGETALDRLPGSDGSRNSVFTRVFLKAIGTPGLNLNTLGATVRDEVHELARSADHEQTPAVYDKLIGSTRVYFAGETAAADQSRASSTR